MRTKKFLLPIFITLALFTLLFFGGNQMKEKSLASLGNVITARVTINPLEVNISAPLETEIGKVFKVDATLINKGEEKIENSQGEIFLADGLVLIQKDAVRKMGIITGKKEKKASWSVKGEKIGNYVIMVLGSGELGGYGISAGSSANVEVKESWRGVRANWFQNLLDFFRERLRF